MGGWPWEGQLPPPEWPTGHLRRLPTGFGRPAAGGRRRRPGLRSQCLTRRLPCRSCGITVRKTFAMTASCQLYRCSTRLQVRDVSFANLTGDCSSNFSHLSRSVSKTTHSHAGHGARDPWLWRGLTTNCWAELSFWSLHSVFFSPTNAPQPQTLSSYHWI